ncbi:MAG: 7-cyano-7-deazaguanine synthase QueC [Myxococcota bacterium]
MHADAKSAVVLLSGGLDSATTLAIAREQGFCCHALSFSYGQRHHQELDAASDVAQHLGAWNHRVVPLELGALGGSALTDSTIPVPKSAPDEAIGDEIPITYVPARNTVFLSFALAWAEVLDAHDIFIGVSAVDYSGYPDCRPEYLSAFAKMAALATRAGVEGNPIRIHAPLIELTKAQTIQKGIALGVDYALTHSCYDPSPAGACGRCDSCLIRRRGFEAAGVADPTRYA